MRGHLTFDNRKSSEPDTFGRCYDFMNKEEPMDSDSDASVATEKREPASDNCLEDAGKTNLYISRDGTSVDVAKARWTLLRQV